MASRLAVALLALTLSAAPIAAQSEAGQTPSGAIAGRVRDDAGRPIRDARISIGSLALHTQADSAGVFVLAGLPVTQLVVTVRSPGYHPANASIAVVESQTVNISVTLVPALPTLDAVVVQEVVQNQIGGTVVDRDGNPVPGAVVDILGLRRNTTTTSDGRFLLLDLDPGAYVLQFRAPGYRVSQHGVRMIKQIDRDITVRLSPIEEGDRFTAEMAQLVAVEANVRRAWRGALAMFVGRDVLEGWDTAPLGVALNGSAAAAVLPDTDLNCILIDGHEVVTAQIGGRNFNSVRNRGGVPTSIESRVATANNVGLSTGLPTRATGVSWLNHFRASEVELVEVWPRGADNSGTLQYRFPPSSGCASTGLVIWLKR